MELYGYAGKILYVNLTDNHSKEEPLDRDLARRFIGGWGINHKLYYDLVPPHIEPLSPDNPLIIGTGPFPGTMVPGSSRTYITYKHPLGGMVGSAPGTGIFSNILKSAGYDHVIITGKAQKPVFLKISENGVEFCDANRLWGKDIFDTVFALRREYEPCSVIAIGPSGENLVNISISNIDTGQGGIGEGGMAAVMGYKNLKAIVAVQGARPIKVAHRRRLQKITDEVLERIRTYPRLKDLREGGGWYMMRNFKADSETNLKYQEEIRREAEAFEKHKNSRMNIACACCPVTGRERINISEGEYAGLVSYHSLTDGWGLNTLELKMDYNHLVKYNDTLNRYGIDRMFFKNILDMLFTFYDKGTITKNDLGGLELKRDFNCIMELAKMVTFREGFGDVIADGVVVVCNKLGLDPERDTVHIKSWNRPLHDPRLTGIGPVEISQLVEARPSGTGSSTNPPSYQMGTPVDRWLRYAREQGMPKEAADRIFTENSFNPARLAKWSQSYFSVLQSLGFCGRLYITRFHDLATMTEYYSAITGVEITPSEILEKGEQNWNLAKILNVREGFNRKDDRPPEIFYEPMKMEEGGEDLFTMDYYRQSRLTREDVERLLDDYYDECGWDKETTAPTAEKIKSLHMEDIKF